MPSPVEEIKDKLDLVEFLKGYLDLRPAGRNFKALCPFHQEKTPSFIVSPERQIWHCFGCGEGGDVFKFLMRQENLEFHEALRVLAEKAGIELRRLSPALEREFGVLYSIQAKAAEFFKDSLANSKRAEEYLKERGLNKETVEEFGIGFAPSESDALSLHLINSGFRIEEVVRAGLAIKTEGGQYRDRFRGRIIFPLENHFGKIVGFSGRLLPELDQGEGAKYLNSPETPIFSKSRLLYGFRASKSFIREQDSALLVEGQMDFLLTWQDGVKNIVATSGTALTFDHLKTLKRLTNKLVLAFDQDEAGQMAAERSIDLAGANDFLVSVLPLDEFSDPAEASFKKPGFIKEAVGRASPALEYYFRRYLTENNLSAFDKKREALRLLLSKIKNLWSPVERNYWLRELAHRLRVSEKELVEEMEKLGGGASRESVSIQSIENEISRTPRERQELVAERILSLLTLKKELNELISSHLAFMPSLYQGAYEVIVAPRPATRLSPELKDLVDLISLRSSLEMVEDNLLEKEVEYVLRELELEYLKRLTLVKREEVLLAEEKGDEAELAGRLREFDELFKKIQNLKNAKEITAKKE